MFIIAVHLTRFAPLNSTLVNSYNFRVILDTSRVHYTTTHHTSWPVQRQRYRHPSWRLCDVISKNQLLESTWIFCRLPLGLFFLPKNALNEIWISYSTFFWRKPEVCKLYRNGAKWRDVNQTVRSVHIQTVRYMLTKFQIGIWSKFVDIVTLGVAQREEN